MIQTGKALLNPTAIWRWGFSLVLVIVGLWLVITNPAVGSTNGRLLGWIIIAYGAIRLLLQRLTNPLRGKREQRETPKSA